MFTREITGLTLTNQVANALFQNITGDMFRYDVSFVATLRALMYERVPKEESISVCRSSSIHSAVEIRAASPKDCIRAFLSSSSILRGDSGIIHIHSFDNEPAQNEASFEAVDAALTAVLEEFVPMLDMTKFLEQKKINARFFVSEQSNSTLIFIERLDVKKWHLLQSFIPRYFPRYFKEHPLQADEQRLLKSLTIRYAPDYEEQIEEYAKRFDFRTQAIRDQLKGFELRFERDRLQSVRNEIRSVNNNLDTLRLQFQDYYQRLGDLTTTELGLIEKINRGDGEKDSEFLEYFLCNKTLNLVRVSGSMVEFVVATTLSNFDPDVFDSAIHSRRSFFYRHYETDSKYENREMTDDRIERLMTAVFAEEKLKIRVCAAYRLDFGTGSYTGIRNYNYPTEIIRDHTPNQHIHHYACLGNNERPIYDAMRRRDYVSALAACCASATNINLAESNTGTFFMERIFADNAGRIIQMPDGSTMTPLDAVKWLEEQDAKKEQETEEIKHEQADQAH